MNTIIKESLHEKKYQTQFIFFFAIYIFIYLLIDSFNMPYKIMAMEYSKGLVATNILINLIMAGLSAGLMVLSSLMVRLKSVDSKGANLSFVSILFGLLTYGCTPCVISFFASVGITFSVIALPLAGLPYKFISLILLGIGIAWTLREMNRGVCKVSYK